MKTSRIIILLVLLFAPVLSSSAVLTEGTLLPVRLTQNVNGNINQVGETVYFQITENIFSGAEMVIRQGTFVKGKVSEAVGRKSLGKEGKLALVPRGLTTENDQHVRFVQDPMAASGRKRTGATVAHVILWGPIGLFAKGRAAYVFLDTEYDIEVSQDVDLSSLIVNESDPLESVSNGKTLDVSFKKYSKKINYRKGKMQKDFTLIVQGSDENISINHDSVRITRVLDNELPDVIEPLSVKHNAKNGNYEATFAFKELIKYLLPGDSKVTIEIGNEDPELYTAVLKTDWKLK